MEDIRIAEYFRAGKKRMGDREKERRRRILSGLWCGFYGTFHWHCVSYVKNKISFFFYSKNLIENSCNLNPYKIAMKKQILNT